MAHSTERGRPLGPITEDALAAIVAVTTPTDGIDREHARTVLVEAGFTTEDADWALQQLVDRGLCYVVDDEVFVTDRDRLA